MTLSTDHVTVKLTIRVLPSRVALANTQFTFYNCTALSSYVDSVLFLADIACFLRRSAAACKLLFLVAWTGSLFDYRKTVRAVLWVTLWTEGRWFSDCVIKHWTKLCHNQGPWVKIADWIITPSSELLYSAPCEICCARLGVIELIIDCDIDDMVLCAVLMNQWTGHVTTVCVC